MKNKTLKTFQELVYIDMSWAGGGIHRPDDHLIKLDKKINEFVQKSGLSISDVCYSYAIEKKQMGTSERNTELYCYLFAAVLFV